VGQTGVETLDLIAGTAQRISPAAVIVIDALCARSRHRLCATVQLRDTGLRPGSGVGNHRAAIDSSTLGIPVIAIGIPTVIAGNSLARELTGEPAEDAADLFLTPRDVASRVNELGRLVGFGISAALHPQLTVEDITGLLS
jgi:spore protease